MTNMTAYLQERLINHVLRNLPYPTPKALYLALFAQSTQDKAEITEVYGLGYKRQPLRLSAPINGVVDNPDEIYFGIAEAYWGKVLALGIFDALLKGNLLLLADMEHPQTVEEGSPFKVPRGEITISLV